MQITATDADDNQNAVIKYFIYDSQNTGVKELFGIDENTGGLFVRKDAAQWQNQMFQFFVRAHDGGTPSLHTDVAVDVYIMAATDVPPQFEKKEKILFLSEASAAGTVITRLKLATNITAHYRVLSEPVDIPQFSINELGELRLAKPLDRESKDLHYIGIVAESDSSPALSAFAEINLHVQDENDNSPVFESSRYGLVLAENVEKGSAVMKVTAHDADNGSNGDVRYSLANDAGELANVFDIDAHTGWITILVPLDKEKRSEYNFQVIGTDNGVPKHNARASVTIKLKDYNDSPSVFKETHYEARISEEALPGTVLLQLSTTDNDVDLSTPIEYYIVSGDPRSQFQIRQTGELYIAKPLDREAVANYLLGVIVTDGTFTTRTNVSITVLDANDNPPYCLKYRYNEVLSEGVLLGTYVLTVQATDADESSNSKLRFYLTGNGVDDFSLDKETGVLKTARQLDRELQSRYSLIAHVQDRDHSGWECSSQINVAITDLNDNAPKFSMQSYSVTLPEDAEVGTLVTKVHATDNDIGVNRKIKYAFVDSFRDHFRIAADSGIITLAKPLDREEKAFYNLTVQAMDQGAPKLSSTATLIVNVQDINDNPPEFTSKHFFAAIPEVNVIGSEVIRIVATSKDTGVNAEVYFSIIGGNEQKKFNVNRTTGIVQVADILDFERARDYFLTIQAVDGGTPPLSNLATLNISISDSNDNAPIFTQNSYSARIREDAQIGDKIIQLRANDLDSGDNGRISYRIERGDRLNQFAIEESTGYISVAAPLDRESVSNYVLEIEASDNGVPVLSNYVLINIEISDANDNAPVFTKSNYSAIVQEDKQLGHTILKFEITDLDAVPNAAPYTFDFRAGNEGSAFRLEQDGILRTAARFNHKVRDSYQLQIRVFDNGTPPLYSDTWVHVQVIEESQYPPIVTPQEIMINSFQEDFIGGQIGRVYATDQDKYDQLTYALVPTADLLYAPNSLFNISKTNGTMYALPRLDIGDYRVNVTVTDGKFTSSTVIKIAVEQVTTEMLANTVVMRFSKVSPEQFVLSHRKTFIRSIRNALGSRLKDVAIVSVQQASEDSNVIRHRYRRGGQKEVAAATGAAVPANTLTNLTHLLDMRDKRQAEHDLDVLFAVRKPTVNSQIQLFYSPEEIRHALEDKLDELEETTNLTVDEVVKSKCVSRFCVHGKCEDKIALVPTAVSTITTDVISFVSTPYEHTIQCNCIVGYGGERCESSVNECANNPCPNFKICVPDLSTQGFHCICPEGFAGPTCDKDINKCSDESCYVPRNPVSFSGKSYAQYRIDKNLAKKALEDQFVFTLRIRTIQQTGNVLYAAGKVDYNILEIVNGVVQYRFDLGSGEGMVSVTSIFVSDGQWHDIKLERSGNSARLIVNGKHVAQGSAPGVNGILNLQSNDLYLGAEVRQHPTVLGFEDVQRGYVGCMDDVKIATVAVPLHMTGGTSVALLKRFANVEFSCDTATVLVPLGVCGTQPCLNGGTCKDLGGGNFECICHGRFRGQYCAEDSDPCASAPCLFGGKCRLEGVGNYSCECPPRMSGKRCDYGRFCEPNPCRNGGVCEEGDTGSLCMCRGYQGPTCEVDVNECENQPCGLGATCINEAGSFRCICPPDTTGASCGDPLYSNSITSKLKNLPMEQVVGFAAGALVILSIIILAISCRACKKQSRRRQHINNINNGKEIVLNSVVPREHGEYKRGSKMSNLEIIQRSERPVSYAAAPGGPDSAPYSCNTVFVNNLDTLRSYGSAGDELEVPPEYRKLNRPHQQQVNINGHATSETDSLHKQTWSDQMHLQSFTDSKINNDLKRMSPICAGSVAAGGGGGPPAEHRCATLKATGILPGRLLNVPLPNPGGGGSGGGSACASPSASGGVAGGGSCVAFEEAGNGAHGTYLWDCSDWARRSQNPLPNITEVPGSEVPDSSSFHSNESNESHPKCNLMPHSKCKWSFTSFCTTTLTNKISRSLV